ncbi:hypothetical protein NX784_12535 [Massilia pinisoli]|uniref:Flagellar hook-length control protein FliK n=1 Tax=Massilia pinisoli TaxID=1772194 RepID=A0ABT1ZR68_9BURK|nr:hypothetical protein [Massilia pinisoli]MCS0582420.1 hypothetical protein [Massilia pinisoli]
MASILFPPLLPPAPVVPAAAPSQIGPALAAAGSAALLQAEIESVPLPAAQPAPAQPSAAEAGQDGAAMRPDQVAMARQMTWPNADGGALASAWRGMVRNYGTQQAIREQQMREGQLPTALLQAGQDARAARLAQLQSPPPDAWRFTVHAGSPRAQHLRVVQGEAEQQQNRRRRTRAALRLELVLADGTVVTVQATPVADGIKMEVCAADLPVLERLRELQPQLEAAVRRAGLRVLAWAWRDDLPAGPVHARLPSTEAATALSLPVFRAMAELALLLPA